MKTQLRVTACAFILASTMMAQRPFGGTPSSTPPDPATIVQNRVARLTAQLGLSSAQASQATTIFLNAETALAPLQASLTQGRQSMQAAVKTDATSTIDQLAMTMGTLTGQISAIENKADAAFYAILTPDQQTTLGQSRVFGGGGFRSGRNR
jgi:Spy/CpxP family protein refolding chaperone